MTIKNMTTREFLILSMTIADGSIASTIIFSNIGEPIKFLGLIMMVMLSAFIVIIGALHMQ